MAGIRSFVGASLFSALALACGCSSDAKLDVHAESDDLIANDECAINCNENDKRCGIDGVEVCVKSAENECNEWQLEKACSGDLQCNSETFDCFEDEDPDIHEPPQVVTEDCEEEPVCEIGTKQCNDDSVAVCAKLDNGCIDWKIEEVCDEGTFCDADSFTCKEGCVNACEQGKKRCTEDNEIEECLMGENGCTQWGGTKDCGDLTCDSDKLECVKNCTPQCTKDEKKCENNSVVVCVDAENDGCTTWRTQAQCTNVQSCQNAACVNTCVDDCTSEGSRDFTWSSLRVCQRAPEGCLKWVDVAKCNPGEMVSGDKCVKVCGNDCNPFSIVLLPDPQEYTRKVNSDGTKQDVSGYPNPNIFADQLNWIATRKTNPDYNIKAVIHLGDITDTNDKSAWKLVNKAYTKYFDTSENKDLPYIVAPGNHDFKQCASNESAVDDCPYERKSNFSVSGGGNFNAERFAGRKWFGEYYKKTNSYITFTAGGVKFLVIALEFAPRKEAIDWANNIINKLEDEAKAAGQPGYKVIIESHAYINPGKCRSNPTPNSDGIFTGSYSTIGSEAVKQFDNNAVDGKYMYDNLTSRHNNIILVINGHHSGSFFRLNKGKAGNYFGELVVDYQIENGYVKMHNNDKRCMHSHWNGGSGIGFLRVLHFNPATGTITAKTHSTLGKARFKDENKRMYCNKYETKDDNGNPVVKYLYPSDYSATPGYNIERGNPAHASTEYHAFTVTGIDFMTPVVHQFI